MGPRKLQPVTEELSMPLASVLISVELTYLLSPLLIVVQCKLLVLGHVNILLTLRILYPPIVIQLSI